MDEKFRLSKDAFLKMAEISGLDTTDPHMEELYSFIRGVFPGLKDIEKLDLGGAEPFMPSISVEGGPK